MPPQDHLAELVALSRTSRARLACWDDLAAGRCTLEQAQAAARDAGQTEAEITRATELFAPFDAATEARFVATLERADAGRVVQPDVARWRRPALAGGLALLAAGLVLWVSRTPPPSDVLPAAAPMVAHELSITGVAEVRGDATATSVPAGSVLEILLRPATSHTTVPIVWACAERDGASIPLEITQAAAKPGTTVRASATLPSTVMPGTWELVAFVSSTAAPADACAVKPAPHVSVSRRPFVVR